jgi:RNA polymerase sigma-70 factor (ECF subfamily)
MTPVSIDPICSVFEAHSAAAFGTAYRIVADRGVADQIAQDVLLARWVNVASGYDESRGPVTAYLKGVARYRAIDVVRQDVARKRREIRWCSLRPTAAAADDEACDAWTASAVRAALAGLPRANREPIQLAFFAGLSYCDVAVALGIPEGTAKARIRSGIAMLRVTLTTLVA